MTPTHRADAARDTGARLAPLACVIVLGLAMALGVAPARAQDPTREQVLRALRDASEAGARRHAVEWLADYGTTDDILVLAAALHDEDSVVRALADRALWRVWSRSGDPEIDGLFARGVAEMQARDFARATETFTGIIERKPGFAEAWNKRATIYYLTGQYTQSLADCDEVMKRNPYHFGALSGYGLIYLQLDLPERALHYFERALAINPNLLDVRATVEHLREMLQASGRETI
jgi:tetratricopeptide (TPR) repeat protein